MFAIIYSPLGDEPDPKIVMAKNNTQVIYTLPSTYKIKPLSVAEEIKKIANKKEISIYIPGRAFDKHGVRHGRGRGWYDRLLPLLPQEWVRVGVCFEHQLSGIALTKQPWDQSMDQVCVVSGDTVCWYETNAHRQI